MRFAIAAAGVLVPALVQACSGWWLDSGYRVGSGAIMILALGFVAGLLRPTDRGRSLAALVLGVAAGSGAVLLWHGPGTLWPIVLVFAAMIAAVAALAGAGLAWLVGR
jgi:hypothetical protein